MRPVTHVALPCRLAEIIPWRLNPPLEVTPLWRMQVRPPPLRNLNRTLRAALARGDQLDGAELVAVATVVTVADVQHWRACRRVTLSSGSTLTESARRWLAEHGIEAVWEEPGMETTGAASKPVSNVDTAGSLLEMQLLCWVPRVLTELGLDMASPRVEEAVKKVLDQTAVHAADLGEHGAESGMQRAVITVLGRDRVGIIAALTSLLAEWQANVLDINQTLFGDLFSMNMAIDISRVNVSFAALKEGLERAGEQLQLKVLVQRKAVFDYMHRV
jgi:ACT domain-containing protein